MTMYNPETGNISSQLKTFKTLCATFSAQVRELVCELIGEYGLCMYNMYKREKSSLYICSIFSWSCTENFISNKLIPTKIYLFPICQLSRRSTNIEKFFLPIVGTWQIPVCTHFLNACTVYLFCDDSYSVSAKVPCKNHHSTVPKQIAFKLN